MADKKISELNQTSIVDGSEIFPIVQANETKSLSINSLFFNHRNNGEAIASKFATGNGSESSPFTSQDGSGGINAAISSLTRGGKVVLGPNRFNLTNFALISSPCVVIDGNVAGANIDPNGEVEGITGNKLSCSNDGIRVGDVKTPSNTGSRLQGVKLTNLYFWNSTGLLTGNDTDGYSNNRQGAAAINIIGSLDQPLFENINFGNFPVAFRLGDRKVYPSDVLSMVGLDTPHFKNCIALNCGYGFLLETNANVGFYGDFSDNMAADCDNAGLLAGTSLQQPYEYFSIISFKAIRCARVKVTQYDDAAIDWQGENSTFIGCFVQDTGHVYRAGTYSAADRVLGLALKGNNNTVSASYFIGNTKGPSLYVKGNNNRIINNSFSQNNVDIYIEFGAQNTCIVSTQSLNISNYGINTTLNGVNISTGTNAS